MTLTGSLADPYPLLGRFDVFTLPSRGDSFPLVVLEAMHLARPVVAFDVGDVAAQVGDAGCLVAPGDVGALADAVVGLLRDPGRRDELGRAGRARVERKFSHRSFAETVRALAEGGASLSSVSL